MDSLNDILMTFDKDDKREFERFLRRKRDYKNRKDIKLFQLLSTGNNPHRKDFLPKLYEDKNTNAYHSLRKRLFHYVMDYILLKNNHEDTTNQSQILGYLILARYLFTKKVYRSGWNYLIKAEDMAQKAGEYHLLSSIYYTQVEQSDKEYARPLKEILTKKEMNSKLTFYEDRSTSVYHLIKDKLSKARIKGEKLSIRKTINQVIRRHALPAQILKSPKFVFNILSLVRLQMIEDRDFLQFEKYLEDQFRSLQFDTRTHYYKVNLIYYLAHTLYRNMKFDRCLFYLEELKIEMEKFLGLHYTNFYPYYIILKASVYTYTGLNTKAIEILREFLQNPGYKPDKIQRLNLFLNLTVLYFQKGEYGKAIRTLNEIQHSDTWFIKNMGMYDALKKQVIECITHFENTDYDFVSARIRSIEKLYKPLLDNPDFQREKKFFELLRSASKDPDVFEKPDFKKQVSNLITRRKLHYEDLQTIAFAGWLIAKTEKKNYYELLIKMVRVESRRIAELEVEKKGYN